MKRISLVLLTFLLGATAFAQSAQLGFKGGLNISHLTNNQNNLNSSRLGFHAGILAHVHVNPMWAVQPELVYSSQGAKYTVTNGEHQLSLNYFNIPILLQYMFSNGFRLQTGPQIGFLTGVTDKQGGVETGYFTSSDFKNTDVSWSAGLGYQGASGLGIDARYNFGLNNINNAGTSVLHNSVFQVGLFYLLSPRARRR